MNIFARIRQRLGRFIAALLGSMALFGCGLLFSLYLAPQQKLEARRIEQLPLMDASTVAQASPDDDIVVTGYLTDNQVVFPEDQFVAYEMEEWRVTVPEYDPDNPNQEPDGSWESVERAIPELIVDVGGQIVISLRVEDASMNGALHESIFESNGFYEAEYMGDRLPEGSRRVRGFYNGDLITLWGKKAVSGGIIPDELYAGDRVSFEESQHAQAKGLLIAGVSMLVISPIVLVGGTLSAIFGRRQK